MGAVIHHDRANVMRRQKHNPKPQHGAGAGERHGGSYHKYARFTALLEAKGVSDAEDKIGQKIADPAAAVGDIQVNIMQVNVETIPVEREAKGL